MYGPPDEIEAHPSGGHYERPLEEGGGSTSTYPFAKFVGGNQQSDDTSLSNLSFVTTRFDEEGFIAGMVSGLRGAAQYEKQAGLPGAANERWDMFGSGLLAAAVLILAGNLVNVVTGLLRRRKK